MLKPGRRRGWWPESTGVGVVRRGGRAIEALGRGWRQIMVDKGVPTDGRAHIQHSATMISDTCIDKQRKRPSFGSSDDEPRHWRTEKLGGRRLVDGVQAFGELGRSRTSLDLYSSRREGQVRQGRLLHPKFWVVEMGP